MIIATADLYDRYDDSLAVALPVFQDYGGRPDAAGRIATVKCYEDNALLRETVASPGDGRVLVVDGGGSLRCALLGDQLATLAIEHGWAGVVIHGCVRDTADLKRMPLMIKALASTPRKSTKRGEGQTEVPVRFADIEFVPGHWLYADGDGLVTHPRACAE